MTPLFEGNTCVVGLQWGDEGKGKIVDYLAESAQMVVRYCGGANAGHTVRINGNKYSTHLLPVGIFRPGIMNLIANGVVLDPEALFKEIDEFIGQGIAISPANLRISYKTHVVMPWHKAEDAARESASEGGAIGTTRRGIGPAYADKMQRTTAIRVADLLNCIDGPAIALVTTGEALFDREVGRRIRRYWRGVRSLGGWNFCCVAVDRPAR